MDDYGLTREIPIGEKLTQDEVESAFGTDFGYQFRGITYRNPDEGKYVILLSNEGEIYDDQVRTGTRFTYVGEGVPEKGDQEATPANRALVDAVQEDFPIYHFTSEEGLDEYEYRGLVDVVEYEYVNDGERMVYEFEVEWLEIASWTEYERAQEEVEESSRETPTLEEPPEYETTRARARSAYFSRRVKEIYEERCAVCGERRLSPEGNPEVEAAHVYPKSEEGSDDLRNGIALCRLHHWAFDVGWFGITDDLEVVVKTDAEQSPPEGIQCFDGEPIRTPTDPDLAPHPLFLAEHRRLHQLEI